MINEIFLWVSCLRPTFYIYQIPYEVGFDTRSFYYGDRACTNQDSYTAVAKKEYFISSAFPILQPTSKDLSFQVFPEEVITRERTGHKMALSYEIRGTLKKYLITSGFSLFHTTMSPEMVCFLLLLRHTSHPLTTIAQRQFWIWEIIQLSPQNIQNRRVLVITLNCIQDITFFEGRESYPSAGDAISVFEAPMWGRKRICIKNSYLLL